MSLFGRIRSGFDPSKHPRARATGRFIGSGKPKGAKFDLALKAKSQVAPYRKPGERRRKSPFGRF